MSRYSNWKLYIFYTIINHSFFINVFKLQSHLIQISTDFLFIYFQQKIGIPSFNYNQNYNITVQFVFMSTNWEIWSLLYSIIVMHRFVDMLISFHLFCLTNNCPYGVRCFHCLKKLHKFCEKICQYDRYEFFVIVNICHCDTSGFFKILERNWYVF